MAELPENLASVNYLKLTWIKNKTKDGGAMEYVINNANENEIVILSHTKKNGRMWASVNPDEMSYLTSKNRGIYEVIHKYPHKLYFDIDASPKANEFDEFIDEKINTIKKYFPEMKTYSVSGNENENKWSLHVVTNDYLIKNDRDREIVKETVRLINDDDFDWKVYTKNRNMKCVKQAKRDDNRIQEILRNEALLGHFITCFIEDTDNEFIINEDIKLEQKIERSKRPIKLNEFPKMKLELPGDFTEITDYTNNELLRLLPLNKEFNHDYTHMIARFCYYNDVTFEEFMGWMVNKYGEITPDYLNKWETHWSKLDKFPKISIEQIHFLLGTYYPKLRMDKSFAKFANTFNLPEENIVYIDELNQGHFNTHHKYLVANVCMGGGKTTQTINYLNEGLGDTPHEIQAEYGANNKINDYYPPDEGRSFVWISPNKALLEDTYQRIGQYKCNHYQYSYKDNKYKDIRGKNERVLICLNSLWKYKYTPDVLVIDECESVFNIFGQEYVNKTGKKNEIWIKLIELFRRCNKIILLDAFITTKTINLIKMINSGVNENMVIYEKRNIPSTRDIYYCKFYSSLARAKGILQEGKKIFIYYPYKSAPEFSNNKTMMEIHKFLEEATGKKGRYYNADIESGIKNELKDVNTFWSLYDFVIVNKIVTCGVSFDMNHFDEVFIYVENRASCRELGQVSMRVRKLLLRRINIIYIDEIKGKHNPINKDFAIMNNCPIYKELYNNMCIEKWSPLKNTLSFFFKKAQFRLCIDDEEILEDELEKNNKLMTDILSKYNFTVLYENIEDIDSEQCNEIIQKTYTFDETLDELYQIKKYKLKGQFVMDDFFFPKIMNYEKLMNTLKEIENCMVEALGYMKIPGECMTSDDFILSVIWNNNLSNVLDGFRKLYEQRVNPTHEKHTIELVREYYEEKYKLSDYIVSEDVLEINKPLPDYIIDAIKNDFEFYRFPKSKKPVILLKHVYNTYFCHEIIKTKYNETTHRSGYVLNKVVSVVEKYCELKLKLFTYKKNMNHLSLFIINNTDNSVPDILSQIFLEY